MGWLVAALGGAWIAHGVARTTRTSYRFGRSFGFHARGHRRFRHHAGYRRRGW